MSEVIEDVMVIESPAFEYVKGQENKFDIYARIQSDLKTVNPYFEAQYIAQKQNLNFYSNDQWTPDEINKHTLENRKARVFNDVQSKIDHLRGTETQTRLDAKCQAREKGDEAAAELLTFIIKWVEQVNNFEFTKSEVFTDGLLGYGVATVKWDTSDIVHGYPKIERIPPEQIVWDTNAKKSDLTDARWMARCLLMTRMDAIEIFPDHLQEINAASFGIAYLSFLNRENWLKSTNLWDKGRQKVSVIEYYERIKIYKTIVIDDIEGKEYPFMDSKDAEDFYQGKVDQYASDGTNIFNPDGSQMVMKVTTSTDAIQETVIIGDQVVEHFTTALNAFPYVVFFSNFIDGKLWAFCDGLISPQQLENEFFSQWEWEIGTGTKGAISVMQALLAKGYDIETLRQDLSQGAAVIPVMNHQAINPIPNTPINPALFEGITFSRLFMSELSGGKNALGLQENAAESGKAVEVRVAQGGLSRLPLYDNLRKWQANVMLRVVWFIKNIMTPGQILRVLGNDEDVSYVNLDDELLDSLREIKVDITIDEASKSDSSRERNFEQLIKLKQTCPNLPDEVWMPMIITYSSIPQSKKDEMLKMMQFYQEYEKQKLQQNHEQKLQQDVQDSLYKRRIKDQLMQQENIDAGLEEVETKRRELDRKLRELEKAGEDAAQAQVDAQNAAGTPEEQAQLQTQQKMADLQGNNIISNV
jgi:hypothetical protein